MSRIVLAALAAAIILAPIANPAEARPRHHYKSHRSVTVPFNRACAYVDSVHMVCGASVASAGLPGGGEGVSSARIADEEETIIGGRPAGCPHAYCGCGLRHYLGIDDPRLNLAWNWARLFQRDVAAPGRAAVWHHHVALIEQVVGPHMALLRDYNSGRGLSRLHVRSLAGAVIVNPSIRVARL
jgi:hypothetical protein